MEKITFEELPQAVLTLIKEVGELKQLLLDREGLSKVETDCWFDIIEFCIYHPDKPSKPTVYGWVNTGKVPVHKGGKKLRFLKSEIDEWLKTGRKKSQSDITREAISYLNRKGI